MEVKAGERFGKTFQRGHASGACIRLGRNWELWPTVLTIKGARSTFNNIK